MKHLTPMELSPHEESEGLVVSWDLDFAGLEAPMEAGMWGQRGLAEIWV